LKGHIGKFWPKKIRQKMAHAVHHQWHWRQSHLAAICFGTNMHYFGSILVGAKLRDQILK
jgi:hypothetical protein